MKKLKFIYYILLFCSISFVSCDKSDLLYDTSQKHLLYFIKGEDAPDINKFSFVYYSFQDTVIEIPIKYVGTPSNTEQEYRVKIISDTIGVLPKEGEDYEFLNLKFPANQVEASLKIRLKRSEILKDTVYGVSLVFEENQLFKPMNGTFFKIVVEDGELPKPAWWDQNSYRDYNSYLGKYYPEKYRMLLERFNALKDEYPDFYKYSSENFGEFLQLIPEDAPRQIKYFYKYKYSYIWGKYVFEPVWEYFTDQNNVLPDDDISLMKNPVELYK